MTEQDEARLVEIALAGEGRCANCLHDNLPCVKCYWTFRLGAATMEQLKNSLMFHNEFAGAIKKAQNAVSRLGGTIAFKKPRQP